MNEFRTFIASWVADNKDQALEGLQGCLRIPSVKDETTVTLGAPFGLACANALAYTLKICQENGMHVVNLDGYVGYAEFGPVSAPEHIALLGHLDVVPVGDGWTNDPWSAVIHSGSVWSRGAQDDKGPTFAGLYGAIALMKSDYQLKHRVRLIFGCDEESSWQCMDHYFGVGNQPMPKYAFTPDAGFPLYHAEKGSFTAIVSHPIVNDISVITEFDAGLRPNMVPDKAVIHVTDSFDGAELKRALPEAIFVGNTITVTGVSAHGGTPHKGINAAKLLAEGLHTVSSDPVWEKLLELCDCDGVGAGIDGEDALTGKLTLNVGVVQRVGDDLHVTINVRYPATWDESVLARTWEHLRAQNWTVLSFDHTAPLHVPVDQEPVKTLLDVYRNHTGDFSPPKTMGGRTYATSVQPVGVAFGAAMEGDPDVAHRPDEHFSIERFNQCIEIYGHALYRLAIL